ncbi:DUF2339 domain-containing protein [Pseudoalteromonas fenneropenaei]|uniref:DUF2339 domain-containing protein n=1 Tax=Pseudoalteromonas fenneropenaei TaxID=1737459 RepID=A0ABV7CNK3_9GAMM
MENIVVLALFFLLLPLVVACYSLWQTKNNQKEINQLQLEIGHLKQLLAAKPKIDLATEPQPDIIYHGSLDTPKAATSAASIDNHAAISMPKRSAQFDALLKQKPASPTSRWQRASQFANQVFDTLSGNALLWLGGVVLAFGGIFLAKYSIEAGLISPQLRLLFGAAVSAALLGTAEWYYRSQVTQHHSNLLISAALACGGLVGGYALTLTTLQFYAFISPAIAFVVMALLSLCAISLALRFGPLLAYVGLLGALTVPVWVSSGNNDITIIPYYIMLISAASCWICARVNAKRLAWLCFTGHFLWYFAAIFNASAQHQVAIALFTLGSIYLYVLLPIMGWRLQHRCNEVLPLRVLFMPRIEQAGLFLALFGFALFYLDHPNASSMLPQSLLLIAMLCWLPRYHSAFEPWPLYAVLVALFTLWNWPSDYTTDQVTSLFSGPNLYCQLLSMAFVGLAHDFNRRFSHRYAGLILLNSGPLLLFATAYYLAPQAELGFVFPVWAFELCAISALLLLLARSVNAGMQQVAYWTAANALLALAATLLLEASMLSVTLTVQIAAACYFAKQQNVTLPDWLLKAAISAVLLRLSVAPWLADYADETILTLPWTVLVYPLVFGLLHVAREYSQSPALKDFIRGAQLHLIALFFTTQSNLWLFGAYPALFDATFHEKVVLALGWLVIAAVYLWRASLSSRPYTYQLMAGLLLIAAGIYHLDISVFGNPFWVAHSVGEMQLLNWTSLLWALPALTLAATVYFVAIPAQARRYSCGAALLLAVLYINAAIRQYFQGEFITLSLPTSQAELYCYSLIWLLVALGTLYFAAQKQHQQALKLGFVILLCVVVKAFLIDMAGLSGLYRALSFLGLGLSLVGIGWLFQRVKLKQM